MVTSVSVCLVLAALIALLMKGKGLGPGSALVCVLFGLVLATTPAGPAIDSALDATGGWLWANGRSL